MSSVSVKIGFFLIFFYSGILNTFVSAENISDSSRYAPTFDGKEIQPRQMQFFNWLFGDHTRKEPRNSSVTESEKLHLFSHNRTIAIKPTTTANPETLPIDWTLVLKEFVKPLKPSENLSENQRNITLLEKSKHNQPIYNRDINNGTEPVLYQTVTKSNNLRQGKQFFNRYAPTHHNRYNLYNNWALKRLRQGPQHFSNELYQHRNRPVYKIYYDNEETNGFDKNDESSDTQNVYYDEMFRHPYRNQQNNLQNPVPFYKTTMLNRLRDSGMQASLIEQYDDSEEVNSANPNEFDEPTRFYDDYEEGNIEKPVYVKYDTWKDEDEIDSAKPEEQVRRSFPMPSVRDKPWGKNCKGSQCSRQATPIESSTNSNNTNSTMDSNSTTAATTNTSTPIPTAASTTNTSMPIPTTATTTNTSTPIPTAASSANTSTPISSTAESIPANVSTTAPFSMNTSASTNAPPTPASSTVASNVSTPTSPSPSISTSSTVTPTPPINNGTLPALPSSENGTQSTLPNPAATPSSSTTSFQVTNSNVSLPSNSSTVSISTTQLDQASTISMLNVSTTSSTEPSTTSELPLPPMSETLNCHCGVQSVTGESVGSTVVRAMTNPWLVEIHSRSTHLCAGSLINNKYVLTSAKCVMHKEKRNLLVTGALQHKNARTFAVTKVAVHPKFNEATLENNIALLRISESVIPSPEMRPICLPIYEETQYCHTGHLVTWVVSNGGRRQIHLLQTEVKLLNQTTCQSLVNEAGDNSILPSSTLCSTPAGKQNCDGGDVGGPLQVYAGMYSYKQIGLVSWSVGCRASNFPAVYTDIRHYLRWILFQTQDGEYCSEPTARNSHSSRFEDVFQFEQIM